MKQVSTRQTPPVRSTTLKLLFLGLLSLGIPLAARAQLVPYPSPYTTAIYTTNTLFIEAEDSDFNHGSFVTTTNIGMDGPTPGDRTRIWAHLRTTILTGLSSRQPLLTA